MMLCNTWLLSSSPLLFLLFPHFIFYDLAILFFKKFLKWVILFPVSVNNIALSYLLNPYMKNFYLSFSFQLKHDFLQEICPPPLFSYVLPIFVSSISLLICFYSDVIFILEYWPMVRIMVTIITIIISDKLEIIFVRYY